MRTALVCRGCRRAGNAVMGALLPAQSNVGKVRRIVLYLL